MPNPRSISPSERDETRKSAPRYGVALSLVALIAVLFYSPLLVGLRTFPDGDFTKHFLPFSQFLVDAMRALELPVWNPYTYAGHPFWADVQAAVLYPVSNALLIMTLPIKSAAGRLYFLQVEATLHILLAGGFTYLLAFELVRRFWPAIIAAVAFMLSGYLTGYPPLQLAVLRTAVWLPALLWLLLRAWRQPYRWRYWIGAAIALAIAFLAGHSQTWMLLVYAAGGWILTLAFGLRHTAYGVSRTGRARIVGLIALITLALGLVSAQLLPSIEYARLTVRADVDYAFLSGGFPFRDTWQMLLPGVLTHYSPLYIGAIPLGLALLAVPAVVSRSSEQSDGASPLEETGFHRWVVGYLVATTLLALLASYGNNSVLYPLLYRVAPGWDMFRGQERSAYLVAFGLSLLAAFGLTYAPAASPKLRKRFVLVFSIVMMIGVYTFGLIWQLPEKTAISNWQYLFIAVYTLVFAMSLAIALWLDGWSVRREWLLCGLTVLNLSVVNFGTNLTNRTLGEAVTQSTEVRALVAAIDSAGDGTGLNTRAYNEYRVYEDYGILAEVEDVWGSSPLRLSTYAALFDEFPLDRMFRLTGVGHVLTWRRELFEPGELLDDFPQPEDTTYLHRLSQPNPRLWIAHRAISEGDERSLELLADHQFDLDATVILPTDYSVDSWVQTGNRAQVSAERIANNRLAIDVKDAEGGILVVSENWMPGWQLDSISCGEPSECSDEAAHSSGLPLLRPVRANLSFIAVALPDGDVSFDLVYSPSSVRIGLVISAVTWLCLVLASIAYLLHRRRWSSTAS